jgi:energy-coupling factor transporter ATP-binding protein EcfA2
VAPAPIRLSRLSIRDFRGIDSLDLDLVGPDGVPLDRVVIGGMNACGKTSVLEAIVMLLTGTDAALPADKPRLGEQVRFGANRATIHADIRRSDHAARATLMFNTDETSPRRGGVVFGGRPVIGRYEWPPDLPPATFEYFSARRDPRSLGRRADPTSRGAKREGARLTELKRQLVSAHYERLDRLARQGSDSHEMLEAPFARLQALWKTFDPSAHTIDVVAVSNDQGSGREVVLRDERPIPRDITSLAMARRLAPGRTDIPSMVALDRLSSGQIALLTFAAPLLFREEPPDIILVDEPEQHLHVQWQRAMVDAIAEMCPTSQVVVATHSEDILRAALSYERFILVARPRLVGRPRAASGG